MEPTAFYVGLYFLVSLLHLASSRVDNYNGWKNSPNVQYHIQTDEGEERYFKYQTKSGQYRKEKRLQDGTVVGTYGWVDPNGYLRLRDYIADNQGYRILKTKMIYVGGNTLPKHSTPQTLHPNYSPPLTNIPLHRFQPYLPPTHTPTHTPTPTPHYPTSTPLIQLSHHSAPKSSTPLFTPPEPTPSYSSTPKPISYASTPAPSINHPLPLPAIGIASTPEPPHPLPPVAAKFPYLHPPNNFITETHKNNLFFRYQGHNHQLYNPAPFLDYTDDVHNYDVQDYDGISTFHNGFRYYLPRHYHEENTSPDGQQRTGSFGYIDPFGIRRVIYYNTAPGRGFVHRKNNRYVGLDATPYDPRPSF